MAKVLALQEPARGKAIRRFIKQHYQPILRRHGGLPEGVDGFWRVLAALELQLEPGSQVELRVLWLELCDLCGLLSPHQEVCGMEAEDLACFAAAGHERAAAARLGTYGAVSLEGVGALLRSAAARLAGAAELPLPRALARRRFLDLGSGDGRAVLAAAVMAPTLAEAAGVELCGRRHGLAVQNRRCLPEPLRSIVSLEQGDALRAEASRLAAADIVWVANLRFPDPVVASLNERLERHCAIGKDAVVAALRECHFARPHTAWTERIPMSWNPDGSAVFCYLLHAA